MELKILWIPNANSPDAVTQGLRADDPRAFTFTVVGNPGDRHIIQPYPLAGDYENAMDWHLHGPGGLNGPKLWEQVGKNPPCRMVIGESIYGGFGGSQLMALGVKAGETYSLSGTKNPNADPYTGPQMGNSVCTMTNGA